MKWRGKSYYDGKSLARPAAAINWKESKAAGFEQEE